MSHVNLPNVCNCGCYDSAWPISNNNTHNSFSHPQTPYTAPHVNTQSYPPNYISTNGQPQPIGFTPTNMAPHSVSYNPTNAHRTVAHPHRRLSHSHPISHSPVEPSRISSSDPNTNQQNNRLERVRQRSLTDPSGSIPINPELTQNTFSVSVRNPAPTNNSLVSRRPDPSTTTFLATNPSPGYDGQPMDTSVNYETTFAPQPKPSIATTTASSHANPTHNFSAPSQQDHPPTQAGRAFKPIVVSQLKVQTQAMQPEHLPLPSLRPTKNEWRAMLPLQLAQKLNEWIKVLNEPNFRSQEKQNSFSNIIMTLESEFPTLDSQIRQDLLSLFAMKLALYLLNVTDKSWNLNYHADLDPATLQQVIFYLNKSETNLQFPSDQNLWKTYDVYNFDDKGNYLGKSSVVLKDAQLAIRQSLISLLRSFCTLKMTHPQHSEDDINSAPKALSFLQNSRKVLESYSQILDTEFQIDFSRLSSNQSIIQQEIARRLNNRPLTKSKPAPNS